MIRNLLLATLVTFVTIAVGSVPMAVLPTYFTSQEIRIPSAYLVSLQTLAIPAFCFSAAYLFTSLERRSVKGGLLFGLLIGTLLTFFLGFHRGFIRELSSTDMPPWPLVAVYGWHIALWIASGGAVAWITRKKR
jgi:hypothetical protein